jgi:hypothetical protein
MAIAGHDLLFLGRERRVGVVIVSLMAMVFNVIVSFFFFFTKDADVCCFLSFFLVVGLVPRSTLLNLIFRLGSSLPT